jgi:hypothetical protein
MYGDVDRQVASIIRQNSENKVSSVPRIAVYVNGLSLDKERLSDSTYVGKLHFRERDIDPDTNTYNNNQGRNYTVERLMPTPFKLTMKCDIWAANTEQKLQLLEQILVLFNPSLELQTTDNYVDWTSLTVLNMADVLWSSKQVPVGTQDTPIDIATLTLDTPIWLSPPVKVKHLGVITKIVTSIWEGSDNSGGGYIDGLGIDLAGPTTSLSSGLSEDSVTISNYNILVHGGQAQLLGATEGVVPSGLTLEVPIRQGTPLLWSDVFGKYPGKYVAGASKIFLVQPNGSEIIGTIAVNPLDESILNVTWDPDTLVTNTGIDSAGNLETDPGYNPAAGARPSSPGTFDAIIDPQSFNPKRPTKEENTDQPVALGRRFLIIEDIGDIANEDGPDAWKSTAGNDFYAKANDIIEWDGNQWNVIFEAAQESDTMIWQTNIYTGVQYLWNGVSWVKSFEGEYRAGKWRIEL